MACNCKKKKVIQQEQPARITLTENSNNKTSDTEKETEKIIEKLNEIMTPQP